MFVSPSRTLSAIVILVVVSHIALAEEQSDLPVPVVTSVSTSIPNAGIPADPESSPDEYVQRLFSLYMDARNTGMFEEAETIAKQIVEFSIEAYGYESRRTAHALTDLGELQTSNADYRAATLNLVAAIEIIERIDDRLSISLVSPLRALGNAHFRSGNANLALSSWQRAVHVSHVNLGPHNYDQVETLDSISRVLAAAEKYKEANKIRRRMYYLSRRNIDRNYRANSPSSELR